MIAANNGDIGGGEVMLLSLADALTNSGVAVSIVGPRSPSGLVEAAKARGFDTIVLEASTRRGYMRALRMWDRQHRVGILWCNGLLPAVATAGGASRLVHLHQRPRGKQRLLAGIARLGALATLVPSADMANVVRGSKVLLNWVEKVHASTAVPLQEKPVSPIRLGFLGRPSIDKGVGVLAEAVDILNRATPGRYVLVVSGESRFVEATSRSAVETSLGGLGDIVERTGWIQPADFFSRIDILVCPSIWSEPFGLVVAESMSARVRVVVSDAGALPEVVGHDHPWISRACDAVDLARVIGRAAQGDPGAVERSYQRWESMFSPEAGRLRVRKLLTELSLPAPSCKKVDP